MVMMVRQGRVIENDTWVWGEAPLDWVSGEEVSKEVTFELVSI